jgi:hypothetical protein
MRVPGRAASWVTILLLVLLAGGAAGASLTNAPTGSATPLNHSHRSRSASPIPAAVPPPMTSKMVPGVPTLGQLGGIYFAGLGLGQAHPATISLGGDGTTWVKNIAWNSWGGPTAVGTGTGYWVGPGQISAAATPEPATIEAFNREACEGKPMYGALEWYFPEQGQNFDPKNYDDVCTGQPVDLTTCPLVYVQATAVLQSQPSTRGDVANLPTCTGTSWATSILLTKYFNPTSEGTPIGFATFHREGDGRWVVAATFIHRDVKTFVGPSAAYCRTMVRKGAPSSLRCPT